MIFEVIFTFWLKFHQFSIGFIRYFAKYDSTMNPAFPRIPHFPKRFQGFWVFLWRTGFQYFPESFVFLRFLDVLWFCAGLPGPARIPDLARSGAPVFFPRSGRPEPGLARAESRHPFFSPLKKWLSQKSELITKGMSPFCFPGEKKWLHIN